jgi:glycosyltransferase involved in cell wall biosynthesis
MRLIIIGTGKQQDIDVLQGEISKLGISDLVDLVGEDPNPYPLMAKADHFVLKSRWEGFSIVLVEAMALSCRVVSTDRLYGPREIPGDDMARYLATPGSPDDLARAIDLALQHPMDEGPLIS